MHKLPYNVMAQIFKFLHPIERIKIESVCRRWNFIGWNFCWMDVRTFSAQIVYHNTLFLRNQRVNKPIKPLLSRCGKYVKEVDLSRFQHDISHLKYLILKSTPNTHTLNVSGLRAFSEFLLTIPVDLPKIKSIDFSGCHLKNLEEELLILFEECEELQSVNLSNNRIEGTLAFDHMPSHLTYLNIEYCDRLSGVALQILSVQCQNLKSLVISDLNNLAGDINSMLCKLTSLEQLVFNNYLLSEEYPSQELTAFSKLIHLSQLELKNNELVTDEVLISIARKCKRLNRILLSNSGKYTEAGWQALDKIPKLKKQRI
uniref:F-box domain-containing protein n=1 Tax=Ditylenchus dipsaci TaxID=166011 RepID=A0A915DYE8_9BILA